MWELIKKNNPLSKYKTDISKRFSDIKSLSGQQILEVLIAVSDEADKQFNSKMLHDFWQPFSGNYSRFIRNMSANLGLNERPLYSYEPISGYNKHHTRLKKTKILKLLPHLQLINPELLYTGKNNDFLLVSYHIWYALSSSTHYFDSNCVSSLREWYLRLRGIKERQEVGKEIVNILKSHQINPSETPLEILTYQPSDLFEYKQRLFTLPQKSENHFQNDGEWVDMIWAFGVYTNWPEPIGYVLFNKELKDGKRLLLPSE